MPPLPPLLIAIQAHFPYIAYMGTAVIYTCVLLQPLVNWQWKRSLTALALLIFYVLPCAWASAGLLAIISNSGSMQLTPANITGPFWPSLELLVGLLTLHVCLAFWLRKTFSKWETLNEPSQETI